MTAPAASAAGAIPEETCGRCGGAGQTIVDSLPCARAVAARRPLRAAQARLPPATARHPPYRPDPPPVGPNPFDPPSPSEGTRRITTPTTAAVSGGLVPRGLQNTEPIAVADRMNPTASCMKRYRSNEYSMRMIWQRGRSTASFAVFTKPISSQAAGR